VGRAPIYDSAVDRLLLILPSATYRAPDFLAAARELGVAVTVASERRAAMSAAMGERALTLRLSDPAVAAEQIAERARETPFAAVVGVDDQGVMTAALGAERLGLPHNPPGAVARTRDKAAMRRALAAAGVPQPRFALLPSGADAAYTLAEAYGPGLRAFIAKMNATAKLLGMTRTHFTNFDGLPWPTGYSTYSTPANLITLGRVAMTSAVFRSITDRRSYRIAAGRGHHAYYWQNLNPLLGVYRGAIGIKTGYTPDAGHCLLFEATRDGRSFIGVNLDSPGIGTTVNGQAATRMLNWAFSLRGY